MMTEKEFLILCKERPRKILNLATRKMMITEEKIMKEIYEVSKDRALIIVVHRTYNIKRV